MKNSSFSLIVKEEIAEVQFEHHCKQALVCGMFKNVASLTINEDKWAVTLKTQSQQVALMIQEFVEELYKSDQMEIRIEQKNEFRKKPLYQVIITDKVEEILEDVRMYHRYLNMDCCKRAFVSGAFLTGGSVNSPETPNYHLEIQASDEGYAKELRNLLLEFGIRFKILKRRNKYILYLKRSESISDTLKIIGCTTSVFDYENTRMERDLTNSLNRLNNIDISNQQRALKTGMQQVDMIEELKKDSMFDRLNDKQKNIANLRMTHSDSSLTELSEVYEEIYGESISKSSIHHIMSKIKILWERMKNNEDQ